jgi:hypothetical protein
VYKIHFQFEKNWREFAFPVRRTGLQLADLKLSFTEFGLICIVHSQFIVKTYEGVRTDVNTLVPFIEFPALQLGYKVPRARTCRHLLLSNQFDSMEDLL